MEEVGVHRGHAAAEPAFGHGMLSVVAVAFAGVAAALVTAEGEVVSRGSAGAVGVHVPHFAVVRSFVGGGEGIPQIVVRQRSMVFDDVMHGYPKGVSAFVFRRGVIACGDLGEGNGRGKQAKQQKCPLQRGYAHRLFGRKWYVFHLMHG